MDINFGGSMGELEHLNTLCDLRTEFNVNNIRIKRCKNEIDKAKLEIEQEVLKQKFNEEMGHYKQCKAGEIHQDKEEGSIRFAYIVFRSMEGVNYIDDAYRIGKCRRCCILKCSCCYDKKVVESVKSKHFFGAWPEISVAEDPDNIKWTNLGYTKRQRAFRVCILWLLAVVLIILSLTGIVIMKDYTTELKKKFNQEIVCPKEVEKEDAWFDQALSDQEHRNGLMHCFCKSELIKTNIKILKLKFDEFLLENEPDQNLYCKEWFVNFAIQNGLVTGTSFVVVFINIATCIIFENLVFIEKRHTINDETLGQFQKITIMQFINIAVVILLVNFDTLDGDLFGFIPILNG